MESSYFCADFSSLMMQEMEQVNKKKTNRLLLWVAAVSLLLILLVGIYADRLIYQPFSPGDTVYIYIDEKRNYEEVIDQLQKKAALPSEKIFRLLAKHMHYPDRVKSGRYAIRHGMTMPDVIRLLRSGKQTPVNLTFNNLRTRENLAGRLSQQLMLDSLTLLHALRDPSLAERQGFNEETLIAMFIPNTYEVYWDTGVEQLMKRMKKEYDVFWNDVRRKKAQETGLTPTEVSILASIVEEEATYADEYPIVAGLYLNRLKRGMRLEADPTVKFAVGDCSLQRILFKHLEVESPYNTYRNNGLPPGPIRIPSIAAIDAALSPQQHHYLFMCAKDDLSGRHNFAVTHAEHTRNAARYQRALNRRGIY